MLQVFGTTSFIHNQNFKKDLSVTAVTGYHLGIAEDSKGWIFWIPGKRIIARLASPKVNEKLFYRPGAGQTKSIQVNNSFEKSMVNKLINQDMLITEISSATNLDIALPTTYQEAIKSVNRNQWITAINDKLESMFEESFLKPLK
ncbi:hypothetical protein O181_016679 [Austropuccinia psidii MF-1]|uniref:Uncharacterized protein n=1 Tax=Austropuccinia psidii MF-1 TaxID=1389203 RepID=A0A9Q3GS20_9BASI|nr:hypothetical protein [Austropuccinia psidii MF-1]